MRQGRNPRDVVAQDLLEKLDQERLYLGPPHWERDETTGASAFVPLRWDDDEEPEEVDQI